MLDEVPVRRRALVALSRKAVLAAAALLSLTVHAAAGDGFGPYGPEGPRMREQLWMLPGGAPGVALRATVFRPPGSFSGRRPVAIINHGTSDATRLSVAMPVYYWLSRWFVERGYVVVLPQRRGHGATGGPLAESIGDCANPNHRLSGEIAADDIEAVVAFMSGQAFVEPGATIVLGVSTGGWASLALASRNPAGVAAIVNFAGGRGGHAGGRLNAVCAQGRLVEAAGAFGRTARVPTAWLYAENDSYFGPDLAAAMATAWRSAGADVQLHILPAYGNEGHDVANDQSGMEIWGPILDRFLGAREAPRLAIRPPGRNLEELVAGPSSASAGE